MTAMPGWTRPEWIAADAGPHRLMVNGAGGAGGGAPGSALAALPGTPALAPPPLPDRAGVPGDLTVRVAPVPPLADARPDLSAVLPDGATAPPSSTAPLSRQSWLQPFGRDLTKTLTFLALHLAVGFTVAYLFTGSVAIAGGIALVEPLVNAVVFFFHERAWRRTDVPLLDILTHRHTRTVV